jgi:hypothetical protein
LSKYYETHYSVGDVRLFKFLIVGMARSSPGIEASSKISFARGSTLI